jgi:23S rRNA pseudouridine2605 synthase
VNVIVEERLQKLLAQAGHGSRRACEELIVQGRVRVNGQVAQLGQKADLARDTVTLDGILLAAPETLTYYLLHKPRGVVSSVEPQGDRKTVIDLVPGKVRLYPVGRLDLDSEGLILLTNDGALANKLTHPRYNVDKEYRVLVKGTPDQEQLDAWRRGVVLVDKETGERVRTRPAQVRREEVRERVAWLRVIMQEGRKHEIRDIGSTLGLPVERIIRLRLGNLLLGDLPAGQWRTLTAQEVKALKGEGKSQIQNSKAQGLKFQNSKSQKPTRPVKAQVSNSKSQAPKFQSPKRKFAPRPKS